MIRKNQTKLNLLHIVLDGLVTALAYLAAYYLIIVPRAGTTGASSVLPASVYFRALIVIIPLYLILYASFGLYRPKRIQSRRRELANICKANVTGLMIFTFVLFAGRNFEHIGPYLANFSTRMIVTFLCVNVFLEALFRNALRILLGRMRAKGFNQKHVLLVGYSEAARSFIDRNKNNLEWGYHILGIIDDSPDIDRGECGVDILGDLSDLRHILAEHDIDEIIVTLPLDKYMYLKPVVGICEKSGVHTMFVPDYLDIIPTTPYTEDLDGLPVVHIRHVPLTDPLNAFVKRTMDIVGSLFAIVIFSPFMLLAAVLIRLGSPGPVIFSQERVGLHNKLFRMYKFRSMREIDPDGTDEGWTVKGDPRVTGIGRIMRRINLDETPQLFNVLRGDMSLVGPRPERPLFVERFKEEIPRYMIKHQVRPGMTGWAQVNGLRGDTSIRRRIEYDLYYIENWTPGLDIKILLMTVFRGFNNAY